MILLEYIEKHWKISKAAFVAILAACKYLLILFVKLHKKHSRIQYILCQCTKGTLAGKNFYQEISSNGKLIANRDLEGRIVTGKDEIIESHVVSDKCDQPSWSKKMDWSDLFFGKKDSGSWKR